MSIERDGDSFAVLLAEIERIHLKNTTDTPQDNGHSAESSRSGISKTPTDTPQDKEHSAITNLRNESSRSGMSAIADSEDSQLGLIGVSPDSLSFSSRNSEPTRALGNQSAILLRNKTTNPVRTDKPLGLERERSEGSNLYKRPESRSGVSQVPDRSPSSRSGVSQVHAEPFSRTVSTYSASHADSKSKKTLFSLTPETENRSLPDFTQSNSSDFDVSSSSNYLRSSVMQAVRDSSEKIDGFERTDRFIEKEVDQGIQAVLNGINYLRAKDGLFDKLNIQFIMEKYKLATISARTIKTLGVEIIKDEAKYFGLSDYEIQILSQLGIITDDKKKFNKIPLRHKGNFSEVILLRHYSNLISAQIPVLEGRKLSSCSDYLFRIEKGKLIPVRIDFYRYLGSMTKLNPIQPILKSDLEKYPFLKDGVVNI